jgi:hypothetical protein
MERLTLDMTAIRDLSYEDRPPHLDAVKWLAAAHKGEVELGIPPQGTLADLGGQFGSELAGRVADLANQPGVVALPQLARLSEVTFPGENLLPGYFVEGFSEGSSRLKLEDAPRQMPSGHRPLVRRITSRRRPERSGDRQLSPPAHV